MRDLCPGYGTAMTSQPHPQPSSDEADREKETSPAGVAGDLEEKAEELGASTGPAEPRTGDVDSPDAGIDSPDPAAPNEPG
jgi:hypothetical protein